LLRGDERRHGYYRTARVLYRFLHRRYGLPNPVDKIEPPKRAKKTPLALMPDQLDQLLRFPHPPVIKMALLFLTDTGCRIGELSNLKPEDLIQTPWGYLAKVRGKTGERLVPISPEVYHSLLKHLPLPYSHFRLQRLISQAFHNAHVPGSAHILRHTFGSLWQGDELVLQAIMGHAYLSTTQIYRHLRTQTLSEQHHKYSPLKMVMSMSKEMNML
jgi:integrase